MRFSANYDRQDAIRLKLACAEDGSTAVLGKTPNFGPGSDEKGTPTKNAADG
jgi:hypothetical protein